MRIEKKSEIFTAFLIVRVTLVIVLLSFPYHASSQEPKEIKLPYNRTLNADLDVRFSDLVIDGQVDGKVDLQNGSLRVSGKITESVSVTNGDVFLDENSYVGGDVLCVNGKVQRGPNSQVGGKIEVTHPSPSKEGTEEKIQPEARPPEEAQIKKGFFHRILVYQWVAAIVLSPLLLLTSIFFFERLRIIKNAIEERPLRCFATGVIGFSFWLFLTWSLPGWYFVHSAFRSRIFQNAYLPVVLLILSPFLLAGVAACLLIIGRKILKLFEIDVDKRIIVSAVGLGSTVVMGFIPIVGWLLWICVLFFGIGAALITRLGTRQVMPKVKLHEGEQRRSTPRFWGKPKIVTVSLALLLPPMLVLGYFLIYIFSPQLIGFAKPEYSVKEAYSVKQLDFVQDHFRFSMQNAVMVPFYLASHKVGALILGEGKYFFSLVKDAPAQVEGNIAETRLSKVYVLADSKWYFSQFEREENLISENVEEILRRAKESLDGIVRQTGETFIFHGVIRKKISSAKMNLFSLRLSGQDCGETFASREVNDEIKYHSMNFKGPLIEILYRVTK